MHVSWRFLAYLILPIRILSLILESGQDEVKREPERMTNKEDTTYAFTRGTEYYEGKK